MGKEKEEKKKISKDLKEIVSTTIESIKEGIKDKDVGLLGAIHFELSVIKSKGARGGFKFFITDASGNYSKESVSRITFSVQGVRSRHGGLLWLHERK